MEEKPLTPEQEKLIEEGLKKKKELMKRRGLLQEEYKQPENLVGAFELPPSATEQKKRPALKELHSKLYKQESNEESRSFRVSGFTYEMIQDLMRVYDFDKKKDALDMMVAFYYANTMHLRDEQGSLIRDKITK